jgi:hypothetical protein
MTFRTRIPSLLSLLTLCLCFSDADTAASASSAHWVGTWAAAPMPQPNSDGTFGSADTTFREIAHVSLGGPQVRIVLTDEFGLDPLTIGEAGIALSAGGEADFVSAQDLIFGLGQLAERAHIHGIKVIGATLTPYDGGEFFSSDGEAIRQAVNQWIRPQSNSMA